MCNAMKKLNSIIMLLYLALLSNCSDPTNRGLCPNEIISELASTRFAREHGTTELWKQLQEHSHLVELEYDSTRPKFVNMQFLFESALSAMLENKQILKSVAVIYAPKPPTPLRAVGSNLNLLLPEKTLKNPDHLNTVVSRHESIREYIRNGGILYSVYKNMNQEESIVGMDIYHEELKTHPNSLKDTPIDNFDNSFTGASYLVTCNNGETIFFSISSSQIGQNNPNKTWSLHYGKLSNSKVKSHYKALKNLYKKSGVLFYLN
jgi:hypothetical protein